MGRQGAARAAVRSPRRQRAGPEAATEEGVTVCLAAFGAAGVLLALVALCVYAAIIEDPSRPF